MQESFISNFDINSYLCDPKNKYQKDFYVVCEGRKIGIFSTWKETESYVKGFSGAIYKKFKNMDEAIQFYKLNSKIIPPTPKINSNVQIFNTEVHSSIFDDNKKLNLDSNFISNQSNSNFLDCSEMQLKSNNADFQSSILNNSNTEKYFKLKAPKNNSHLINEKPNFNQSNCKKIIDIYCDGSVPGNGKIDVKGGVGIVFGDEEFSEVVPSIYGEKMTNNITELYAIKRVLELIKAKNEKANYYKIYSDSEYSILSITKWKPHLRKNQDGKKNLKLIKEVCENYEKIKSVCELIHVRGHQDSDGNNRADKLARIASGADINEFGNKRLGVDISYSPNFIKNNKKIKY